MVSTCYRILLFLLLTMSMCEGSFSQTDNGLNLIKNLSKYRTNILVDSSANLDSLDLTLKLWKSWEPNEEDLTDFIWRSQNAIEAYLVSFERLKKSMIKASPNSILAKEFTEKQHSTVIGNSELTALISAEIIESGYPFKLKRSSSLLDEFKAYEIKENESIAEIGAGTGLFSLLIYLNDSNNKIFVNEIDENFLRYFQRELLKGHVDFNQSEINLIIGDKKNTNLPEPVDKIIIRNTFHHFKKKKKMIRSIKSSLKLDGTLFIQEVPKSLSPPGSCDSRMEIADVISYFNKEGFYLVSEKSINLKRVLEFKLE